MLLRNIDQAKGLCNGTILQVKHLRKMSSLQLLLQVKTFTTRKTIITDGQNPSVMAKIRR